MKQLSSAGSPGQRVWLMYFNAYFKEMKIGARREAWQLWSSCVQLAPGQAALQWPHAKLQAACTWAGSQAACPHPLPLAALLHRAISPSPCSAVSWAGGRGVRRRRGSGIAPEHHCSRAAPCSWRGRWVLFWMGCWALLWLQHPAAAMPALLHWCRGSGSSWHAHTMPTTMGLSQPLLFANPKAAVHPSAMKFSISHEPPWHSAQYFSPADGFPESARPPLSPAHQHCIAGLWEGSGPAGSLSA